MCKPRGGGTNDEKSGINFWIGFVLICIIAPIFSYYIVYKWFTKHERKHQRKIYGELLEKAKIASIVSRDEVTEALHPFIAVDQIINLILDYANIEIQNESEIMDKYVQPSTTEIDLSFTFECWMYPALALCVIPYFFLFQGSIDFDYFQSDFVDVGCTYSNQTGIAEHYEIEMLNV